MIVISCESCRKPLSIDESKLPMQEVSFPCPVCRARLTVDRRTLNQPSPAPVPADEELELAQRCLVIGADDPAVLDAVRALGCQPQHFASAEAARDFFLQEFPSVVILRPEQMTAPPLADMLPITSMNPSDRRKAFIILVAENLRTLDGNAAFLYGVNLVVSANDLGAIKQIYREAEVHHQRLYQGLTALEKAG